MRNLRRKQLRPKKQNLPFRTRWILDSEEKPVELLKFQSQAKENRLIIFGSMALVALTRFLVEIGATRETALILWRQGLEHEARMSAPNLSSLERLAIENKYRQARQTLESEKQRLQAQLNDYIANARQHFADVRRAVNTEEQELRTVSAQNRMTIQQSHDAETRLVNQEDEASGISTTNFCAICHTIPFCG